jgi:hypothetical protein
VSEIYDASAADTGKFPSNFEVFFFDFRAQLQLSHELQSLTELQPLTKLSTSELENLQLINGIHLDESFKSCN